MWRRYSLLRNDGALWIDGPIDPMGESAAALRRGLDELGQVDRVRVVINSPGGLVSEGLAHYVALRECGRPVDVTVLFGGSIASVIAMAGETIGIVETGSFFLHPAGLWSGDCPVPHMTATLFREAARRLDRTDAVTLDIMARRTRLDRAKLRALQEAETTLTASHAIELGFADRIVDDPRGSAC